MPPPVRVNCIPPPRAGSGGRLRRMLPLAEVAVAVVWSGLNTATAGPVLVERTYGNAIVVDGHYALNDGDRVQLLGD